MFIRLALLIVALISASGLHAASVLPLGLERLQEDAKAIFVGTCIANESGFDADTQMVVTYTTFRVDVPVKGIEGDTYTIKQVGGEGAEGSLVVPGVPKFVPGREYVLFLPPRSELGFSSPIGLEQGSFSVQRRGGETYASNGRSLAQLLEKVPEHAIPATVRSKLLDLAPGAAREPSELKVSDLVKLVKELQR